MSSSSLSSWAAIGYLCGASSSSSFQHRAGYLYVLDSSFNYFLSVNAPLAVVPDPPGTASTARISSADRSISLSWSDGSNPLPVQYQVLVGPSQQSLAPVTVTADRSYRWTGLSYLQEYYWQIRSFDAYGRTTASAVFSFSIVPDIPGFYCAPNPFGTSGPTQCVFRMPGGGSARMDVFALPQGSLVRSFHLDDLPDGISTFAFDGNDGRGEPLYCGVYLAVLSMEGSRGSVRQRFKMLVVR